MADNIVDCVIERLCKDMAIALEQGYTSVYYRELSDVKYSDITQTPYREIKIKFFKKPYISNEEIETLSREIFEEE